MIMPLRSVLRRSAKNGSFVFHSSSIWPIYDHFTIFILYFYTRSSRLLLGIKDSLTTRQSQSFLTLTPCSLKMHLAHYCHGRDAAAGEEGVG